MTLFGLPLNHVESGDSAWLCCALYPPAKCFMLLNQSVRQGVGCGVMDKNGNTFLAPVGLPAQQNPLAQEPGQLHQAATMVEAKLQSH
jgi:hypothetical protein